MSRIPTIDPNQATGKAQELLFGVQAKLGMTPNLMRVMANSPAVLEAYLQFSGSLGRGALTAKTREQIALAVAQANSCDYRLSAHSTIGNSVGLTTEQIRDARGSNSEDSKSNAILHLTAQLVDKRGLVSDDDLAVARDAGVTEAEIAEVVANIVITDPQNDFLSPDGVAWGVIGESVTENGTVDNIHELFETARDLNVPVFVSPHYYYPYDHQWKFEVALESLMHGINMFDRQDARPAGDPGLEELVK